MGRKPTLPGPPVVTGIGAPPPPSNRPQPAAPISRAPAPAPAPARRSAPSGGAPAPPKKPQRPTPVRDELERPESVTITPDNDVSGQVIIDERAAEAQALRERRRKQRNSSNDNVRIVESFAGTRLISHVGPLRRMRSSFLLLFITALIALVIAGALAGIVAAVAIVVSHVAGG